MIIWTMAQGCCDEFMSKPLRLMPFFFMPFIILQIMCIGMRVADYGLTSTRYYGIALICFEIAYFILYAIAFIKKKELIYGVIYIGIATVFIIFLMPFLNMESMVIFSQKSRIEAFQKVDGEVPDYIMDEAYEAYRTIRNECGYTGEKYLDKALSPEEFTVFNEHVNDYGYSVSDTFYISAYNSSTEYDVSDYNTLKMVSTSISRYDDPEELDKDLTELPIYDMEGNTLGTIDFSKLSKDMMDIDENKDYDEQDELLTKAISRSIPVSDGGRLIMTFVEIDGDRTEDHPVSSIEIEGFYLK